MMEYSFAIELSRHVIYVQFVFFNFIYELQMVLIVWCIVCVSDSSDVPALFIYPRLCFLHWKNHRRAAFYPPVDSEVLHSDPKSWKKKDVMTFTKNFLTDPDKYIVATEHF